MKRLIDVTGAVVGIVATAPILAIIAVLVRVRLGRPVLFRQPRAGLHGRPFTMVKFRSMADSVDAQGRPLPDTIRLGRFGQWLRATSLDELPTLICVVRGDMSLVGPRPLLLDYLPLYTAEQARRHEVRPGITGWAQIHGRNAIDWPEKLALDVWYVDHRSLGLDLKILWHTLSRVLARDGISPRNQVTMPRFTGSAKSPVQQD